MEAVALSTGKPRVASVGHLAPAPRLIGFVGLMLRTKSLEISLGHSRGHAVRDSRF